MAYMGIINMILITILFRTQGVSGKKGEDRWEHRVPLEVWLPVILKVQVNRHRRHCRRDEGGHPSKREENWVECRAGT